MNTMSTTQDAPRHFYRRMIEDFKLALDALASLMLTRAKVSLQLITDLTRTGLSAELLELNGTMEDLHNG